MVKVLQISGPDGSGKTSLINKLSNKYNGNITIIWNRHYYYLTGLLLIISRILGLSKKIIITPEINIRTQYLYKSLFLSRILYYSYLLDRIFIMYLINLKIKNCKTSFIILDR